jgi:esterase
MPTLPVNGYEMAFVECGTGIPLILVHGSLTDYRWWAQQMQPFGAHYRTIAMSLRHCWPERWNGEGDDFTIQQHTKDVAAFIVALNAGPVHLLGLSRGGHIAFRVAQNFPDVVCSLVLAEPGGVLDSSLEPPHVPTSPPIALGPLFSEAAEHIHRGEIDEGLAPAIDVINGPGGWARLPEHSKQEMRDNARTLLGQIKEQRAPFSRADAEVIMVPTLLMAGERSPENFHRILDGLQTALKDVRRVVIPSASHASNMDNPQAFTREVLAFLEDR